MADQYGYVEAIVNAVVASGRIEQPAIIFAGRETTWRALFDQSARIAGGLRALGVEVGDRVAVLAHNSDLYINLYLAVPWVGAALTHLNWRCSAVEHIDMLQDSAPRVLFIDDHVDASTIDLIRTSLPELKLASMGEKVAEGALPISKLLTAEPVEDAARQGSDLLAIYYTGGTTGRPKGVMLSNDGVIRNCVAGRSLGNTPDGARLLNIAPLFHIGAGAFITNAMLAAGTVILDNAFDPERALQLIEDNAATDAFLVPTMISALLEHPSFAPDRLATLKRITYGSSPISAETLDRILVAAPEVDFFQAYGMTEVSCAGTVLLPKYHFGAHREAGHYRSVGHAIPGVKIKVVDETGASVPTGTVGEIWIGGTTLMLGYWNQPQATAEVLRDGWMHTGDGGYLDENGLLYIVDRLKDMIVSGGENVYSAEVESAISRHPAVALCAVIGVPDPHWGERVHAVIVPRAGTTVTEQEIVDHCRTLIGRFKCPRSVEFRPDGLPLSGVGKVLKHELRTKYWDRQTRNVA
jgi:long-chain acyl-CoA synthetase